MENLIPLSGSLAEMPPTLLLGRLHQHRFTGLLTVQCRTQRMKLWFKRGYLCHSEGDGATMLGQLLTNDSRIMAGRVKKALRRQRKEGKLLGQHLLSLGYIDMEQLEQILADQLDKRLSRVLSWHEGMFEVEQGMASFGNVPLSSKPLNTLPPVARATYQMPASRSAWIVKDLERSEVRMAPDHRIPPVVRELDPENQLHNRLVEWQEVDSFIRNPGSSRLLAVLHAFGHLEIRAAAEEIQEEWIPSPKQESSPRRGTSSGSMPRLSREEKLILDKIRILREGGTIYQVLEVHPLASTREIKTRYRRMALASHPDRVPSELKEMAQNLFSEITQGYHQLVTDSGRLKYDTAMVAQGSWNRHGTAAEMSQVFMSRSDELLQAGKAQLSMEYQRLAATVDRTRLGWNGRRIAV